MLPAPLRAEMRAQAQEQIEAEKRDADVAATRKENEARQASDRAEAAQRKAILENDPNVTAQSLLADPALSAEAKARLGGLLERAVKPDPARKSSGIESGRLLARLYKDDSDPERLADVAPIYDAYTKGRLTRADFEFLLEAFDEQHAAGSDGLFALRKADFLKRARAEIEKPDFVTGEISDEARYESYLFERDLDRKIEDYRKAGKDPFDLLDPNKPDYASSLGRFSPKNNRTSSDFLETYGSDVEEEKPINPYGFRNPNETPDEYLKSRKVLHDPVSTLRMAGFDSAEILKWKAERQKRLSDAGFSERQIKIIMGEYHAGVIDTLPLVLKLMQTSEGRADIANSLSQMPGNFLEGLINQLKMPGDVWNGKIDLNTREGIDQAIGLGISIALGRPSKLPITGKTSGILFEHQPRSVDHSKSVELIPEKSSPVEIIQPPSFTATQLPKVPHTDARLFRTSDGQVFVASPHGSIELTKVPAVGPILQETPVVLRRSILRHLDNQPHAENAISLGYRDGLHLTLDVLQNWTEIHRGEGGRLVLSRPMAREQGPFNAVVILQAVKLGKREVYNIATSGARRDGQLGPLLTTRLRS